LGGPTNHFKIHGEFMAHRRAGAQEKDLVTREEVERCIREVMDGEHKDMYRRNAAMWMHKAKETMQKGGCSDKNIAEFTTKYSSM
jgi:hypothetical protein